MHKDCGALPVTHLFNLFKIWTNNTNDNFKFYAKLLNPKEYFLIFP